MLLRAVFMSLRINGERVSNSLAGSSSFFLPCYVDRYTRLSARQCAGRPHSSTPSTFALQVRNSNAPLGEPCFPRPKKKARRSLDFELCLACARISFEDEQGAALSAFAKMCPATPAEYLSEVWPTPKNPNYASAFSATRWKHQDAVLFLFRYLRFSFE